MVNEIPEGWNECRLGDYVRLIKGISYRSEDYCSENEGYIFINLKCVARNGGFRAEGVKFYKGNAKDEQFVKSGDIVIANTDLTQNREIIGSPIKIPDIKSNKKMCISLDISKLDIINKNLNNEFLYYYLMSPNARYFMISNSNGTTVLHLLTNNVPDMLIPLPPLTEQRAIASVLSSLDDKIDLLQRENQTLEQIAETLFRQWFVEEASEDWEEVQIGNLFDITSGKGLRKGELLDNGKYPVLGANGFIGKTNNYLYDEKLIYTGRVGTLGNVFIVDDQKVWLSDNTLVIRPHSYFYSVYFVLKYVMLENFDVGSTQPLIRQSDIKRIKFSFPSEITIKRFELQAQAIYLKIKNNIYQIQTLEKIRDILLPKLMSGEVRVTLTEEKA